MVAETVNIKSRKLRHPAEVASRNKQLTGSARRGRKQGHNGCRVVGHNAVGQGTETAKTYRLRFVSFKTAEGRILQKKREVMFRPDPGERGNAMRPRISEREQAPALQSAVGPRSPAHFGVRRLAAAFSLRELPGTRERRSLPDFALSPPEWLMAENRTLFTSRSQRHDR
jgi:hypothetical protein